MADNDKYIRYDDGEFTIKVIASVNEDFSDSFTGEAQAVVFRKTDPRSRHALHGGLPKHKFS